MISRSDGLVMGLDEVCSAEGWEGFCAAAFS